MKAYVRMVLREQVRTLFLVPRMITIIYRKSEVSSFRKTNYEVSVDIRGVLPAPAPDMTVMS